MSQNPFETPLADPQYAHAGPITAGQIDIGQAVSDGWRACWENFPLWLGVMIVAWLINTAAGFTVIGYFIVTPVLMYGQLKFTLNMLEPNKAEFNDLFAGFSNFGAALLPMLGLLLVMILPFLPVMLLSVVGGETVAGIATLLLMVGYVVVLPRIGFAFFFAVDRGTNTADSLRASWEATRGQWFIIVGLGILATLIAMAGLIALFVGVFATAQIAYLMYASAYRQLAGR